MEPSRRTLWVSRYSGRNFEEKNSIVSKLSNKDKKQLFYLADIVAEIEFVMENPRYATVFAYYTSSSGVTPIVAKLPTNLPIYRKGGQPKQMNTNRRTTYPSRHFLCFPSTYTIQPKSETTLALSTRESMSWNQLIIKQASNKTIARFSQEN